MSITDDLHLIKGEYTNFAKLAYWGLVRKEGTTDRGGRWEITDLGRSFIRGNSALQKTVWVYRGVVQRNDERNLVYPFYLIPTEEPSVAGTGTSGG